jgi:murein L,D-transpeptidase YafK
MAPSKYARSVEDERTWKNESSVIKSYYRQDGATGLEFEFSIFGFWESWKNSDDYQFVSCRLAKVR